MINRDARFIIINAVFSGIERHSQIAGVSGFNGPEFLGFGIKVKIVD